MTDICIDNVSPTNAALLIDRASDVILKHGGICTRIEFSTVEEMTPEAFVRDVVPQLTQDNRDSLIVLREPVDGHVTFIYGNSIIRYNITKLQEMPLDVVVEQMRNTSKYTVEFNFPWPVLWVSRGETSIGCIVEIPSTQIVYKNTRQGILRKKIWLPPLWFCSKMSHAGGPLATKVFAVPTRSVYWKDTTLQHVPLNNVGYGGGICFGSTRLTGGVSNPNVEAWQTALINNVQLFMESEYNNDLGGNWSSAENTKAAWERWKREHHYTGPELTGVPRVVEILTDPQGWKWLKYTAETVTPADVVRELEE